MKTSVLPVALLIFCLMALPNAVGGQEGMAGPAEVRQLPDARPTEQERFEFEKFNEARKARMEVVKAAITGASLLIPLLIGIYTVRAQARASFELKAAETVMDSHGPFATRRKADVLRALFPKRLPSDFAQSFEPGEYAARGPSSESKLELLKLIVAHPNQEQEIVQLWRRMYPDDGLQELFPGDDARRACEGKPQAKDPST
jgi:hypothetical protein